MAVSIHQLLHPSSSSVTGIIQRQACSCGRPMGPSGECAECRRRQGLNIQPKLRINQPGDRYEQEADRVAEQVVGEGGMDPNPVQHGTGNGMVQRSGQNGNVGDKLILHRQAEAGGTPVATPDVTASIASQQGGGQPLESTTRDYMESRFRHSFANVRVYDDANADQVVQAVNARAFTLGHNVYFGAGEYSPSTTDGQRLLAHELTHVVQQADAPTHTIQRKLELEGPSDPLPGAPPRTKLDDVQDSFNRLSPGTTVDPAGVVTAKSTTCTTPARTVDRCICDLTSAPSTWTIKVDDSDFPHTTESPKVISIMSTRSGVDLGAWGGGAQAGQRTFAEQWRTLAHEMCGHAWLLEQGIHPAVNIVTVGGRLMSRPHHDPTVAIENQIATEIEGPTAEQRGLSTDPHAGESFGRITMDSFASNSETVPATATTQLDQITNFMNANSDLRADVVGHADNTGPDWANNSISTRRALRVRAALESRGLARNRFLRTTGVGTSECTSVGDDPACRKVEVYMYIFQRSSLRFP